MQAGESIWLLVPFLGVVAPLAGAVIGWKMFRRALFASSAIWGATWFVVWLAFPGVPAGEAALVGGWLFLAPCLLGGVIAALATRIAGGRLVGGGQQRRLAGRACFSPDLDVEAETRQLSARR